jgi:hypothetical protein
VKGVGATVLEQLFKLETGLEISNLTTQNFLRILQCSFLFNNAVTSGNLDNVGTGNKRYDVHPKQYAAKQYRF